jgi:cytochrome c
MAATLVASGLAALGAQEPASVWDGIYSEEQALRGEPLYVKECASCHGAALEGLEMSPALAGGEFLWNWNGLSVGDLFERLRVSMPEGKPRTVSPQDKADILAYMLYKNNYPRGEEELVASTEALKPIAIEAAKPQ